MEPRSPLFRPVSAACCWYGRGVLLACAFSLSGCGQGEPSPDPFGPGTITEDDQEFVFTLGDQGPLLTDVAAFRVSPPVIRAQVGDTFWVEVIPLDENSGHYSDLDPAIEWEKPDRVWLEDGFQGTWVSVRPSGAAAAPGPDEIEIVGVSADGVEARFTILLPPSSATGSTDDWVGPNLSGIWPPGSRARRFRPIFSLIDAEGQDGCGQDQRFAFGSGGFLGEDKTEGCQPGGAELALFSAMGGAILQEDPDNTGAVFKSGPDRRVPTFQGSTKVLMDFWYWAHPDSAPFRDRMEEDLKFAQIALDRSGAGISLSSNFPTAATTGPGDRKLDYPGPTCLGDIRLYIDDITNGAAVDPSNPRIHVIYAEMIVDSGGYSVPGAMCDWDSGHHPVVLISRTMRSASTLAHELGHVFGLNGRALRDSGHTVNLFGFDSSNLMGYGSSGSSGGRDLFTLGQVYRMHFDPRSWIWDLNPNPLKPERCCLGSPYKEDPCPPMWIAAWEVPDPAETYKDIKSWPFSDFPCPGGTRP